MAKKGSTGSIGMFAFGAILLNVIAWLISVICSAANITLAINGRSIPSLLTGISSIILLLVVLVVAYDFAKRQTKGWRIFYWVVAIVSLLAIFFGVGINFVK